MTPDPVYGDPTAPFWDLVMAVDEAAYRRPLLWSRRRVLSRKADCERRTWKRERDAAKG